MHPVPKVKIHEIEIDKKRILVVEVKKSEVLCSVGGIAYIRIGTGIRPLSVQEVVMLSSEMGTINWDEVPIISRDAIKGEYLEWYFSRIYELRGRKIEKCDWERYLRSVRAMRGEKLTNAGVLFLQMQIHTYHTVVDVFYLCVVMRLWRAGNMQDLYGKL